jgi:hypothetical protein
MMLPLKKVGENVVSGGYYTDTAASATALLWWIDGSLLPFFKTLQKAILDEFKLIPQMLSYDTCVAGEWNKGLSTISILEEIIKDHIIANGSDPFQLQIVIECTYPHISWRNRNRYEV